MLTTIYSGLSLGWSIALPIICLVVGLIVGALIGILIMRNYIKKNPPINEQMIRAMMSQMGRTPSEKQVRQVMAQMNSKK